MPFDEASVFIIKVCESELADEVVEAGRSVIQALGRDPVGCKAVEVLPSSTELGLSFCRAVAQMKKPIADVGQFTNANGDEVYYRSILLPLSSDQENVDYVLVAFSFKIAT